MSKLNWLVVSLSDSTERRSYIRKLASSSALGFQFIDAFTPDSIPVRWEHYFRDEAGNLLADLKPGELACYASHLEAMKRVMEDGCPALITEDDVEFDLDPVELMGLLSDLPADWGFVRLSGLLKSKSIKRGKAGEFTLREPIRVPNGLVAYLASPHGAQKFISYSQNRFRAIDEDLRRVWEHRAVNYVIYPLIARESKLFQSTIDLAGARGALPERRRWRASSYPGERYGKKLVWLLSRLYK